MDFLSLSGESPEWELGPKEWMKECHFEMVTPDTLRRVIEECLAPEIFGADIEGTGLDSRVFAGKTNDTIVGICLAPNEKTGYYIPLFHKDSPHNIPRSMVESELIRLFKGHSVWHNAAFDHEFLEHPGGTPYGDFDDVRIWEDTMLLKYCLDARSKKLGLKGLALLDLGLEMYELEELFPESHNRDKKLKQQKNFSLLDPSAPGCLYYACADAICTLRLYNKYYAEAISHPAPGQPNLKNVYTIEKLAVAASRWMEREGMKISMDKVMELMALANRDLIACTDLVYSSVSVVLGRDVTPGFFKWIKANFDPDCGDPITEWRKQAVSLSQIDFPDPKGEICDEVRRKSWPAVYDVFSPQQLGKMFEEAEVPGLTFTEKSKQVATDADTLDALIEEQGAEYGWIRAIGTMRTVIKAMSSYLYPLMKTVPDNGRVKIRFKQLGTDTGRYATPTGKSGGREELEGLPLINFHSIPNTYNDPLNPRPPSMSRLRETVVSEEGFFIVSVDFSGEELRIVTNISRERKWIKAFYSCVDCGAEYPLGDAEHWPPPPPPETCTACGKGKTGDLHTLTADALYPGARATDSPETWKVKRGNGKIANFLLLYGGGGGGLSAGIGVDKHEGYRMARNFKTTYTDLSKWWEDVRVFARKHGYVLTPFGRKYPVPDILPGAKMMNGEPVPEFFRAKAERNAINGPIQACIHPDSRIPTDLGLLRVEDLHRITEGRTFQVWTGLHWSDAETVRSEVKETVVTIFAQGHHIKTSSDHRFYVWKDGVGLDWAAQSELVVGSWVAQDASTQTALSAPPGLVQLVGDAFQKSSVYDHLSEREKETAYQMVLGFGDRQLCRRIFDLLPESEQCSDLKRALSFGWSQVIEVQATGESVVMYDLQVHDHDHAFVCDGVVVHNCGADFIKIAMALTYRKLKKMGMLDRVRLIATMHDELVWEIHGSVLTEIIPVIVDTMTNNPMIRRLKWPIPFTSDVEVGLDFTVPWNYKKCADKGKWPAELLPYVGEGKAVLFDLVDRTPPPPPPGLAEMIKQVPAAPVLPRESADPLFRFRITFPTSSINALLLAEVIAESANSGTRILVLEDASGNPFEEWVQFTTDGKPVRVNHHVFRENLRKRGL